MGKDAIWGYKPKPAPKPWVDLSGVVGNDGIDYSPGGPVGGTVIPSQTYTGHTDFETDGQGKRTGTGGGIPVPIRTPSQAEQLLARPDLADPNLAAHNAAQFAVSKPSPIQSIASQMAAALRAGGETGG